jgi:hypothetical protein
MCYPYQDQDDISAHESLDGLCIVHTKLLKNITSILCLANESPIFNLLDLKSKKECEFTHHGHLKPIHHDFAKLITIKDNVINIYLACK